MELKDKPLPKQYCMRCGLPASFPGIRFDDKGICNHCLDFKGLEFQQAQKAEYSLKFSALLKQYKGQSSYDVLMCFSGGKDSTYTLALLRERYGLNVLAVSFDNGFLPEQTLENIYNVVDQLSVDHIMIKPRFDILAKIFSHCADNAVYPLKALERSSAICNSCMAIIKYSALRLALEKGIPFVSYGWSPGQAPISSAIMKNIPSMVKKMQQTFYQPLFEIVGKKINPYFLESKHFDGTYQYPYNINPMAFLDYNIEAIYQDIGRFGWKKPQEVDANSTNCLLNSYANYIHKKRLGFHPYAFEMANLVRQGNLDRSNALQRLEESEKSGIIELVQEKLRKGKASSGIIRRDF